MDGFKNPQSKPETDTDLQAESLPGDNSSPEKAEASDEVQVADAQTDEEADEAVVAGVAAIGGIALKWHHVKHFFKRWWNNKKLRYLTLSGAVAVLAVLFIVPLTRYGILNAVGLKASASLLVVDDETGLPLKNAIVRVGGAEAPSGDDGWASVSGIRLGDQSLQIVKPGYGDYLRAVRIHTGGNTLDEIRMIATGTRFAFRVTDWHNEQELSGVLAEATASGASAFSDGEGLVKLATPPSEEQIEITFSVDGYNTHTVSTDPANFDEQSVRLVKAGYNAFISKRDGEFDLYRSLLDGSEVTKIVEATGRERQSSLALSLGGEGRFAALVSTRDGERNDDGFVLSGLYMVELETGNLKRIDLSETIDLIGWAGDRLVYVAQTSGESGYSPQRFKIRSIQPEEVAAQTLETSNYFYGVTLADGRIYYGPGESFRQNRPPEHFMSMLPDGSDKRTHVEARTVRIARTDFDTLVLETVTSNFKQQWYSYSLGSQAAVKLDGQPVSFEYWSTNAEFINSPDGNWLIWQEERDGKDVIVLRDGGGAERILVTMDGAQAPLRWLGNDLVVFRVVKPGETADYIISLANDAEPVKLGDVTNVAGN